MKRWLLVLVGLVSLAGCQRRANAPVAAEPAPQPGSKQPSNVANDMSAILNPPPKVSKPAKQPHAPPTTDRPAPLKRNLGLEKQMGVPIYPGAEVTPGADAVSKTSAKTATTWMAYLTTHDQAGAVADFYEKALAGASVQRSGQAAVVRGRSASGDDVVVAAVADMNDKSLTQIQIVVTRVKRGKP